MQLVLASKECETPTAVSLEAAIQHCLAASAQSIFILATDADGWDKDRVDPVLQAVKVPLFGGIFPRIIVAGECRSQGTLVLGLAFSCDVVILDSLSTLNSATVERCLLSAESELSNAKTIITLIDGLANNIELLTECLYDNLGRGTAMFGGGCGSLSFERQPALFSNRGLIADAAVLAAFDIRHSAGVRHGWEILDGPYLVTGSTANILSTLNYVPAYEVYRAEVERHSTLRFAEQDFFEIAKNYPLGILGPDGDIVVRDPLRAEGNNLICVGEIPQNTTVYILESDRQRLVNSAADAAAYAINSCRKDNRNDSANATTVIFDCISRCLFMGESFHEELEAIIAQLDPESIAFGALTIGEISTSRNGAIHLLNKSTVIAVF